MSFFPYFSSNGSCKSVIKEGGEREVDKIYFKFLLIFGIISRIVPSLGLGCQIGTRFKKSVNCIPTFEKVLQLGPFQTELTNVVSQRATCQSLVFFIF